MTSSKQPRFPDTILEPRTTAKLLAALKSGVIDMAHFADIYFPPIGQRADVSQAPAQDLERFVHLCAKIEHDKAGEVVLSRRQKLGLLNAVRSGRINLHHEFPELGVAYRKVHQDWSALTAEEREFIIDFCITYNN